MTEEEYAAAVRVERMLAAAYVRLMLDNLCGRFLADRYWSRRTRRPGSTLDVW